MSLLFEIADIYKETKKEFENRSLGSFETIMDSTEDSSILMWAENRKSLAYLLESGYKNKIQMIYADPPFFSKNKYSASFRLEDECGKSHSIKVLAYDDMWDRSIRNYAKEMIWQLLAMKGLLAENGVIAVHLDWHAVHYARLVMDEIFGAENFVNEIIWSYKSGGSTDKRFARKHDNIVIYSKGSKYKFHPIKEKSYNRGLKPYKFPGVEEFQDEIGWYTLVNAKDVWNIDAVGRTSGERTGYATQKPEKLLERLITAFTDEGDTVMDLFAGSGTTVAAAQKMKRKWICGDKNPMSIAMSLARTTDGKETFRFLKEESIEPDVGSLKAVYENGHVELIKYLPKIIREHFDDRTFKLVEEIAANRPQMLINFVSFDTDYDGKIHRSKFTMKSQKGIIKDKTPGSINAGKKIHIITSDIFGNFSEAEVKV